MPYLAAGSNASGPLMTPSRHSARSMLKLCASYALFEEQIRAIDGSSFGRIYILTAFVSRTVNGIIMGIINGQLGGGSFDEG